MISYRLVSIFFYNVMCEPAHTIILHSKFTRGELNYYYWDVGFVTTESMNVKYSSIRAYIQYIPFWRIFQISFTLMYTYSVLMFEKNVLFLRTELDIITANIRKIKFISSYKHTSVHVTQWYFKSAELHYYM